MNTIWFAECREVFSGYGVRALGRDKDEALAALWAKYKEVSKEWNHDGEITCRDLNELRNEWGVATYVYKLGEAYFGSDEYKSDEGYKKAIVKYVNSSDDDFTSIISGIYAAQSYLDLLEQRDDDERCPESIRNITRFLDVLHEMNGDELKDICKRIDNKNKSPEYKLTPSVLALLDE